MNAKNINIEFYNDSERDKYSDFVSKTSASHIFALIEWKDFLENTFKFKSYYLLAKEKNGEIIGVLPLFYIKNFAGTKLESVPYSAYGGPVGREECIKPLIRKAIELKKELNCNYLLIKQPPNGEQCGKIIESQGLGKTTKILDQYLILKDPSVIWEEMQRAVRRNIIKAKQNNVIIERVQKEQDLMDSYELEVNSRKRFGIPTISFKHYRDMWNSLHPNGHEEVFTATYNDKIVAFNSVFICNNRALCVIGAPSVEGKKIGAHTLLLWEAINWSFQQGHKIFDFGVIRLDEKKDVKEEYKGSYLYKVSFSSEEKIIPWYIYPETVQNKDRYQKKSFMMSIGMKITENLPLFFIRRFGSLLISRFYSSVRR